MNSAVLRRLRPRPPSGDRTRSRGQSITEFALVIPVMLLLFAMAADLGRLFYAQVSVVNAAKEGAAYGATNPICVDDSRTLCQGTNNVEARVALEAGDLAGGVAATSVQCLDPGGGVRTPLTTCEDGDTYVVTAAHTFRLLTPIVGQILGQTIVLESEARSRVVNLAFDPTPGASVQKEACAGAGCTDFVSTPTPDETNTLIYLEVDSGTTITYRVTVTNIGGEPLTSTTVSDNRTTLPIGTGGCPTLPSTLAVGAAWVCVYSRTAPNTGGPPDMLYENLVTFDASNILPRQGAATVRVIAAPAALAIAKSTSVYQQGGSGDGPFGSADTLTAHRNGIITAPEVWFRITVTNTGGQDATGFGVVDDSGALPTGTTLCPPIPSVLTPSASWSCRYARTFTADGTVVHTATASASNTGPASDTTTIQVQQCATPNQVVPKLVGRTKTQAQADWTAAGFTGAMTSWPGQNSTIVVTQNRVAYDCLPPSTTVTVTR